jgi:hypothetical protein
MTSTERSLEHLALERLTALTRLGWGVMQVTRTLYAGYHKLASSTPLVEQALQLEALFQPVPA